MTRYQLSLVADKLPRRFVGRPNPYAEVTVTGGPAQGTVVGRTETMRHAVYADWCTVLFLETDDSIFMPIKVSVYDERGGEDRLIAEASFEATEIFKARGRTQIQEPQKGLKIYATVEESQKGESKGRMTLHLRGLDIKNVEPGLLGLGRSDPFFEISKKNADHAAGVVRWNVIYRSEPVFNHLNPYWKGFIMDLEKLCYGDLDWPLKITVYDYQHARNHREIGEFETTPKILQERVAICGNADRERAFELSNEKRTKRLGLMVCLKADIQLDEEQDPEAGQ